MPTNGPLIYLEDDKDDQDILREVIESLDVSIELKVFEDCETTLAYLRTTAEQPFLIITDVNLPKMNGFELREKMSRDPFLRSKSIPHIFLTTSASKADIAKAYEMQVQGYFQKEYSFIALQSMMRQIIDYWKVCKHPNAL